MSTLQTHTSYPMDEKYNFTAIEKKWQKAWNDSNVFATPKPSEQHPKRYILNMFPYPSGHLHMGHVRALTIGDVLARYARAQGLSVLHPMGFDSFGLPAENAAMKDGVSPEIRTPQNIASMKQQIEQLGISYDWSKEIITSSKTYYLWNQWLFLKFLKAGLIYRRESTVNFCTHCNTVLANEQVEDGQCWRCSNSIIYKKIPEWAFKITQFADDLLDGLADLNLWSDRITSMQRTWIGRSLGAQIKFTIAHDPTQSIDVFTTRADTLMGVTFISIAPDHQLAQTLITPVQKEQAFAFIEQMAKTDKIERIKEGGNKQGVFTGSYCIHPVTKNHVPIWLANFVLSDYGTGAVMGVPAHDARDFEFAHQYQLPLQVVIQKSDKENADATHLTKAMTEPGILINSSIFNGLDSEQAKTKIISFLTDNNLGQAKTTYHLRDWGFSRQRYWGTPIPIIHCKEHGAVPVRETDLPVELPAFERVQLTGTGTAPLSSVAEFVNTTCPECGAKATREIETMDTFVDSAWYFFRYLEPQLNTAPFNYDTARTWLPMDIYIGGPEHAVAHLLYFRFFTRALYQLGLSPIQEPAKQLITQGMVLAYSYKCTEHGYLKPAERTESKEQETVFYCVPCMQMQKKTRLLVQMEKMSKSKHNGVDPQAICQDYGADTARMYMLFAAPVDKDLEYQDRAVEGVSRFLARLYRLYMHHAPKIKHTPIYQAKSNQITLTDTDNELRKILHKTIKRVTESIEKLNLNVNVAAFMELCNEAYKLNVHLPECSIQPAILKEFFIYFSQILAPYAPHLAEELFGLSGGQGFIQDSPWPRYDEQAIIEDTLTIAVQINGKLRGELKVSAEASSEDIFMAASAHEKIKPYLDNKTINKKIYVKNKLLSIVVT